MDDRLPPASWTSRDDLARLIGSLGPGQARYVGGAVRDTLLGQPVKDIDIATRLLPRRVMSMLQDAEIKCIPTGIDHGTVTAVLPEGPVEITTLRHDIATDGRRATVAFASDWREDAARRDFTINALYVDPATLAIYDYFEGRADLAARRVRFIGDARQRIREDHLRILRYFRFQARFGSQPADPEAEEACQELASTLKGLSRERVSMELMNLLALPDPSPTVARMAELGVLRVILPEADPGRLPDLITWEKTQDVPANSLRRLASLLPPDPLVAEQIAARLRLSGEQKKRLAAAAARTDGCDDPRALAYRLGRDVAVDQLLLDGADIAPLTGWQIPQFPLRGRDIVARGVHAGPAVARILHAIETRWIAEGFPDSARVNAMLDEELAA
ncbi:MAG: CCA tRNA nucleotidyltransferase [Pseudomonadota bacterium]